MRRNKYCIINFFSNFKFKEIIFLLRQVTPQERAEETAFFDALFGTAVIKATHQFLVSKGLAQPNVELFKEQMKNIWFGLYQRAPGKQGSSGFEHVFLGEFKNGISGLHSWVRFVTEEAKGDLNYLGYTRVLSLGKVLGQKERH